MSGLSKWNDSVEVRALMFIVMLSTGRRLISKDATRLAGKTTMNVVDLYLRCMTEQLFSRLAHELRQAPEIHIDPVFIANNSI